MVVDQRKVDRPCTVYELRLPAWPEAGLVEDRLLGVHHHRTSSGVLAEQGALRAAQHLDLLHVEGIQQLRLHAGHHEVIDEDGDRCLVVDDDVGVADAAHGERRRVEAVDLVGGEVRHQHRKVLKRGGRELGDRVAIDRGDCDRSGLQVRRASFRRDGD